MQIRRPPDVREQFREQPQHDHRNAGRAERRVLERRVLRSVVGIVLIDLGLTPRALDAPQDGAFLVALGEGVFARVTDEACPKGYVQQPT